MDHGDRETKGDDEMRKLIKGVYLISSKNGETILTLIPENAFSYENTKAILDKRQETSIVLENPTKPEATLYEYPKQ